MKSDDKRQTCYCGHRYGVHATGGTQCQGWVNDPDRSSLMMCRCQGWEPTTDGLTMLSSRRRRSK